MAFCQNCGSQLSAGARFCTNCGEGIAGAAQPSAPPADAAPALHNPALHNPTPQTPPEASAPPPPPPQAPYQTTTLPYQPDPHGGAQGGPQAQRAEIKEMFFTMQGRLNRKPFLLRGLGLGILSLILSSVMGGLAETSSTVLHLVSLLMLPLILVCAAGSLTLIIRRWHDLGKSGWFTLLLLIPLLNFLVMLYLWFVRGTAGPNAYGEDPLG